MKHRAPFLLSHSMDAPDKNNGQTDVSVCPL